MAFFLVCSMVLGLLEQQQGLLTVASDRIRRAFNRLVATRTVALDISKSFDRVWHIGLLHKLKGCVCYIFASLFCKSKGQHLRNKENVFSFTSKALFVLEITSFLSDFQMS